MQSDIDKEPLGQRIRRLRKERGLSQITLAEQAGVTDAWISQLEMGRAMPSAELINKLAQVFKIPVRELLQDEEADMELLSLVKLVEVLLETNQPDEAEPIVLGLQGHTELTEVEQIKVVGLLGECRYQQKSYDEVIDLLLPLVMRLETDHFHDAHLMAGLHNKIGKAHFMKQEVTNALYRFRKAHDLTYRFAKFDALAANIAYNVGMVLRQVGNWQDAIFYLERAQEYYQQNKDLGKLADSIFHQGIAYKSIKEYAKAAECFTQAKSIYFALNQRDWSYKVQMLMAYSVTMEQDKELALQQLQDCAKEFEEEKDDCGLLFVCAKIAFAKLQQGQMEEAWKYLRIANELVMRHSLEQQPEAGEFYRVMAQYFYSNEDYGRAIEYAQRSAELFASNGLINDQVNSLKIAVAAYEGRIRKH